MKPWHAIAGRSPVRARPPAVRGRRSGRLHPERAGREAQARAAARGSTSVLTRAVRHAAIAQAARQPGGLAGPPEAGRGGLRAILRPVPRRHGRRQRRRGRLPAAEAPRLSPRDLQVHLDDLRLQAAPRGPDPDGPPRHPRHVDAVVQPAGPQGPRCGRRLRPGADAPRRARGRAGRGGRGHRRGRHGAGAGADRSACSAEWEQARGQVVYPTTPMPEFTPAIVEQGKKAFLTLGCAPVPRRRRPRADGDERRGRRLGQPDQGGRPDLGDAPRRDRAAGHLPPHRRGHQRHADAVVPRHRSARSPSGSGTWSPTCSSVADTRRQRQDPRVGHAARTASSSRCRA